MYFDTKAKKKPIHRGYKVKSCKDFRAILNFIDLSPTIQYTRIRYGSSIWGLNMWTTRGVTHWGASGKLELWSHEAGRKYKQKMDTCSQA